MLNQTNPRVTGVNQDIPQQAGAQGHSHSGSLHSAQFPEVSWLVDTCFLWSDSKIWCQSHDDPSSASLPRALGWFYFLVLPYFFFPSIPASTQEAMNVSLTPFRRWTKAGSNDHLHYIKIVIPRLVFYYIILFYFLKKEKTADDSKNESFWLFVCISWSILALSVFFSPLDCGHLEDKRHVLLALVSSFLITVFGACQTFQLN